MSDNYLFGPRTLAVLVRDRITRREFDALYPPFMEVIPLATINGVH